MANTNELSEDHHEFAQAVHHLVRVRHHQGEQPARMNSGLLGLISPKIATIWSVNRMRRAAIPQVRPKVSARKGTSVLIVILDGFFDFVCIVISFFILAR